MADMANFAASQSTSRRPSAQSAQRAPSMVGHTADRRDLLRAAAPHLPRGGTGRNFKGVRDALMHIDLDTDGDVAAQKREDEEAKYILNHG